MLCINCGNHIHFVTGDKLTQETPPNSVSWPLYNLHETEKLIEILIDDDRPEKEKADLAIMLKRIRVWATRQTRNPKGQFSRVRNFPKDEYAMMGTITGESRIDAWSEFTSGKEKMCNFIIFLIPGTYVYPLYDCKFIKYHTLPSKTLDRMNDPKWSGEFQIPETFEVI